MAATADGQTPNGQWPTKPILRKVGAFTAALGVVVGIIVGGVTLYDRFFDSKGLQTPAQPSQLNSPDPHPSGIAVATPGLPEGWHPWIDPSGYSVAVPDNYIPTRISTDHVAWDGPSGVLLRIQVTDQQRSDPYVDWKEKAAQRKASGCYQDYAEIGIRPVNNYFLSAADWEFGYVENGVRLHVRIRGFVTSATRAYGVWWSAPESVWQDNVAQLDSILRSFQPGTNALPPLQVFNNRPIPCA